MEVLKLILLSAFVSVAYQDWKDRYVYGFLFPVIGICAGILLFQQTSTALFLETLVLNLLFVSLLLGVVFLYASYKLKLKLSETFGLGDGLLFIALAFSFTQLTFITVFVFGLIGSLLLHLVLKKTNTETVPLAGYMSLFFALAYGAHWTGFLTTAYTL